MSNNGNDLNVLISALKPMVDKKFDEIKTFIETTVMQHLEEDGDKIGLEIVKLIEEHEEKYHKLFPIAQSETNNLKQFIGTRNCDHDDDYHNRAMKDKAMHCDFRGK